MIDHLCQRKSMRRHLHLISINQTHVVRELVSFRGLGPSSCIPHLVINSDMAEDVGEPGGMPMPEQEQVGSVTILARPSLQREEDYVHVFPIALLAYAEITSERGTLNSLILMCSKQWAPAN